MVSNLKNRKGAVMVEYGLLAALIALALITAITTLGGNLNAKFTSVGKALE